MPDLLYSCILAYAGQVLTALLNKIAVRYVTKDIYMNH
jgi:hypothetical protein